MTGHLELPSSATRPSPRSLCTTRFGMGSATCYVQAPNTWATSRGIATRSTVASDETRAPAAARVAVPRGARVFPVLSKRLIAGCSRVLSVGRAPAAVCLFDLVIFESGVHDFAMPYKGAFGKVMRACQGPAPCSAEQILPSLLNQSWRLFALDSYRAHLRELMEGWARCRKRNPAFRPIFKLVFAPNQPATCLSEWGYNTDVWHMQVVNQVAREVRRHAWRSHGLAGIA